MSMSLANHSPIFESLLNLYYKLVLAMVDNLEKHGFQNVKQVSWRGNEAWRYLLPHHKGGYELILWGKQFSTIKSKKDPATAHLDFFNYTFLLRYYPNPNELVFEDFSIKEQLVRLSRCFEEGEIFPRDDCSNSIDETFFTVGTLVLSVNDSEGIVRLSLQTQDRFTSILEEPLTINDVIVKDKGEVDRNVPGWHLSWDFYRSLLNIYISRLGKPWLVVAYAEPGMLWKCRETYCSTETAGSTLLKNIEIVFIALRRPETVGLLEEALDDIVREKMKKTSQVQDADTIELPYIRVLFKDDSLLHQDDPIFQEVIDFLSAL